MKYEASPMKTCPCLFMGGAESRLFAVTAELGEMLEGIHEIVDIRPPVAAAVGEDTILFNPETGYAANVERANAGGCAYRGA